MVRFLNESLETKAIAVLSKVMYSQLLPQDQQIYDCLCETGCLSQEEWDRIEWLTEMYLQFG